MRDPNGPPVELRPLARLLVSPPRGRAWHRLAGATTDLTTRCGQTLDARSAVDADSLATGAGRTLCRRCWPEPPSTAAGLGHVVYWDTRLQTIRPGGGGGDPWLSIDGRLCLVDVATGVRTAFDLRATRPDRGAMTEEGPFAPLSWWAQQMTEAEVLGAHVTTAPGVKNARELVRAGLRRAATRSTLKAAARLALLDAGRPLTLGEATELLGWGPEDTPAHSVHEAMLDAVAIVLGLRDRPPVPRGQREDAVRRIFLEHRGRPPAKGYERQLMMKARRREDLPGVGA